MSDPFSWEFWAKDPDSIRNLALTLAALLAATLGTVLAIWRTIAANRSSKAAAKQAETGVQSHITENFTKAVEQLGSDKLDVRLGAIYALARIAQDSERDYWPIMQTLTAYVREKRPRSTDTQSLVTEKGETTPPKIPVDIQSVLAVLGSRKHEYEKPHQLLDLSDTDLWQLDLRSGENHIGRIILIRTNLSEATLSEANFSEANLHGANLRGANLSRADLSGADLGGADLSDANLSGANLSKAFFSHANLSKAYLGKANLFRANLFGTNLSEANLKEANLREADLSSAKVSSVYLIGADLSGAKLRMINLTCEQLTSAKNWESAFRDSTLACGADIPQAPK